MVEAHDISAFQAERLHMVFFDFLNAFVNLRDRGRKILKSVYHGLLVNRLFSLFSAKG